MTIHFRKQCIIVDEVICNVKCESKRNKKQPKLVMQGFANKINILGNNVTKTGVIS